jgi:hypothetical protein
MNDKTPKNGKPRWFLDGFLSVFDMSGHAFISIPDFDSGFQKDREALMGDWKAIGNDMRRAMNLVAGEQQ